MNAKGISYVVTKGNMIAAFGEERWTDFMAKLGEKGQLFRRGYYVRYPHARWKN